MRNAVVIAGGLVAAAVAITLAASLLFQSIPMAELVFLVAAGHALLLGLPAALLLASLNKIRWWSAIVGGFLCGAIPTAVWTWPLRFSELKSSGSQWDGEQIRDTMIEGVPTAYGWFVYSQGFSFMGAFGVLGGLAFWVVWARANAR